MLLLPELIIGYANEFRVKDVYIKTYLLARPPSPAESPIPEIIYISTRHTHTTISYTHKEKHKRKERIRKMLSIYDGLRSIGGAERASIETHNRRSHRIVHPYS